MSPMKLKHTLVLTAIACGATLCVRANEPDLVRLARAAVDASQDGREARSALRAAGAKGLQALLDAHAELLRRGLSSDPTVSTDPDAADWRSLCAALDEVGGAKDNYAARLYWYTDLEQAKAAARVEARPILSLRLLGNLDDEFSCANSRFFRTVLYANAEVSRLLRERFVLHWQSVRPAPRVTIDFGDGRVLERTVTGNSIHYVLDSEGRVVDALPGLYSPAEFMLQTGAAGALAMKLRDAPDAQRAAELRRYHAQGLMELRQRWTRELREAGAPRLVMTAGRISPILPRAEDAAPVAVSKMAVEAPLLTATRADDVPLRRTSDELGWERLAQAWLPRVQLDAGTLHVMRSKSRLASACPDEVLRESDGPDMIENFRRLIALDTVRNEYLLHSEIHRWFAEGEVHELDPLNERVYRELFLTPEDDPWLGLLPRDVYSALPADGVTTTAAPGQAIANK